MAKAKTQALEKTASGTSKRRLLKLAAAAVIILAIMLIAIFLITVHQVSKPTLPRCDIVGGSCMHDCEGNNFITPYEKRFDCPEGLICCLP